MRIGMFSNPKHDLFRFSDGSSVRTGWDRDIDPVAVDRKCALLLFVPAGHKPAKLDDKFEPIPNTAVNPVQVLTMESLLDLLWTKEKDFHD